MNYKQLPQLISNNIKLNMRIVVFATILLMVFANVFRTSVIQSSPAPAPAGLDKIISPCQNPDFCVLNLGSYYNPKTCRCECNNICKCKNKKHQWYNYPTCQCACKIKAKCSGDQYWDSPTCSCKCKYQIICFNPAFIQDPQTCKCVCKPIKCKPNEKQDQESCKCVPQCAKVTVCGYGKKFNYKSCKCE